MTTHSHTMQAASKALPEMGSSAPLAGDANFAHFIEQANKRGLQRTIQALFREGLLNPQHLILEGSISWLPLWAAQALLRFEGLEIGRMLNCQLHGAITYYHVGNKPKPITDAGSVLLHLAPALQGVSPEGLHRLIQEVENSAENDALCLGYRHSWAKQLRAEISAVSGSSEQNFIAALHRMSAENPALLLEQWGTLGHPWHPGYKTKLGLTAEEVMAMSPEFQADLKLPLAALRTSVARVSTAYAAQDYRSWFSHTFPRHYQKWQQALSDAGHEVSSYLPIPLHPYQAERQIPQQFGEALSQRDLIVLEEVTIPASPTMSFRTVVPERAANVPNIKLPVALRLTSVQRTVSPKSTVMGPRITALLDTIVAREAGFGHTLDFLGEAFGMHYLAPQGSEDLGRHLSVLYRANPMEKRTRDLLPVPVGALYADTPFSGRALVTELVSQSFGDHAQGALAFYEYYLDVALTATLSAYLVYGIAFEAHQQNSYILVDKALRPTRLLVRDFGDLRIHGPSLQATGLSIEAYSATQTVYDTDLPVREKFLHATLICHISELGLLLARSYHTPEVKFWQILRHKLESLFLSLRPRTNSQRWQQEYQAILEADWPVKSLLKMRLMDCADDVHGHMPNPLAGL